MTPIQALLRLLKPKQMSNKQTDEQGKPLTYWGGLADEAFEKESKINNVQKLKAIELFFKYRNLENKDSYINNYNAKKCASIAVDEILNDDWYIATREDLIARKEYWNEVKQEIEKL